jgi:hypothetical protein
MHMSTVFNILQPCTPANTRPLPAQAFYSNVSQPPGRGPVLGLDINYTRPREVLLEFVILFF